MNNRISGKDVKTTTINVLSLLKEVKNKQKNHVNMMRREIEIRDPHQTSSSELTWKSVGFTLTEKRKGYTWRKVFPIWCFSLFQVVMWLIHWVHTMYQEWGPVWYMGYHLILLTAVVVLAPPSVDETQHTSVSHLVPIFFIALNMIGSYISILFISEGEDLVLMSTLVCAMLSVVPET